MNADVTFCASLFIMMSVLENATYMHQRRNFTCSNCEGLVILTCCCIRLRNGTKAYRKLNWWKMQTFITRFQQRFGDCVVEIFNE